MSTKISDGMKAEILNYRAILAGHAMSKGKRLAERDAMWSRFNRWVDARLKTHRGRMYRDLPLGYSSGGYAAY